MDDILKGTGGMLQISAVVFLLVLAAMMIDLAAGLYKAKQRGELRTSEALRRSMSKFISYEGGLMIATMVDVCVHFCKFWSVLGVDILVGVPVVTSLVGIFLLVVEFMSVREKADQKTMHQQERAAAAIARLLTREEAHELLRYLASKGKDIKDSKEDKDGADTGED